MTQTFTLPPVQDVYENAEFDLALLYRAFTLENLTAIQNRTFNRCRIVGPAVLLAAGGVRFSNCDMGPTGDDVRNLLLKPMGPRQVIGTIPVQDCVFEGCQFFAIGYTGADAFLEEVRTALSPSSASLI